MDIDPERVPVIVGVGQAIERDAVVSVVELAHRAVLAASADAPRVLERIERLSFVAPSFSRASNRPASELAARLRLDPVVCEVSTAGGNSPQWLMNRACAEIAAGRLRTTLLCGAEATRSMRLAEPGADFLRISPDAGEAAAGPADPVVGTPLHGLLEASEIKAKLMRPADLYPVFESALAARAGATPAQWRVRLGALLSRALRGRRAQSLRLVSRGTDRRGDRDTERRQPPHGRALHEAHEQLRPGRSRERTARDEPCAGDGARARRSLRVSLGGCDQHRRGADAASGSRRITGDPGRGAGLFRSGGRRIRARSIASISTPAFRSPSRSAPPRSGSPSTIRAGLTLTGGMSFFGGPGNNYTSHGIAAATLRLRDQGGLAYVSGNGGFLSKHSLGIYSAKPRAAGAAFVLADTARAQAEIDAAALPVTLEAEGEARVDGSTVVYGRDGQVEAAPIIATLNDGRRLAARAAEKILPGLAGRSLVGETVRVTGANPPTYE